MKRAANVVLAVFVAVFLGAPLGGMNLLGDSAAHASGEKTKSVVTSQHKAWPSPPRQDRDDHDDSGCRGLSGAIFTTTADGSRVNGNIYSSREDVYLAIGRGSAGAAGQRKDASGFRHEQHSHKKDKDYVSRGKDRGDSRERDRSHGSAGTSAGLPDGLYYFQVTDPSGKKLLSLRTESIQSRQFEVLNGYIQGLGDFGTHYAVTLGLPFPQDYTIVQLYRYLQTDNPGGEYKVWVTPAEAYQPGKGVFGFIPSCSKTDNFKVRKGSDISTAFIGGTVFLDEDQSRENLPDPAEPGIGGILIKLYRPGQDEPDENYSESPSGQWTAELPLTPGIVYRADLSILIGRERTALIPTTRSSVEFEIDASGQAIVGGQPVDAIDFGLMWVSPLLTEYVTFLEQDDALPTRDFTPENFRTAGGENLLGDLVIDKPGAVAALVENFNNTFSACGLIATDGGYDALAQHIFAYLQGNANPTDPQCQLAQYWLSLSLAILANTVERTSVGDGTAYVTLSGAELVYVGPNPIQPSPQDPAYMPTADLLAAAAGCPSSPQPSQCTEAYLVSLQLAAENRTYVWGDYDSGGGGDPK